MAVRCAADHRKASSTGRSSSRVPSQCTDTGLPCIATECPSMQDDYTPGPHRPRWEPHRPAPPAAIRAPPALSRTDKHAALCGRFGAAGRVLRSGTRVQAVIDTPYCHKDARGFVWKVSRTKAIVRLDGASENVVLPAKAFCVEGRRGTLLPAANAGGFIRPEITLTDSPTGYVFKVIPVGGGVHVSDRRGVLEAASALPPAHEEEESRALNATSARTELLSLFAVEQVSVAEQAAAGAVAAGALAVLCGVHQLVSRPVTAHHLLAVRPDFALLPAHAIFLASLVEHLDGTIVDPFAPLPNLPRSHVTVFMFGATSDELQWVLGEATRLYLSVFVVMDSHVPPIVDKQALCCIPVLHVAAGPTAAWDVLDALHYDGVDPAMFSKLRDPWGRSVAAQRLRRVSAPPRRGGGIESTLLQAQEVILTVASSDMSDPEGNGGALKKFVASWPAGVRAQSLCSWHSFVLGATPRECAAARGAIAKYLSLILSYSTAHVPEDALYLVPMVSQHGCPRTAVAVSCDLRLLLRSFQNGVLTALVGLPIIDTVIVSAVRLEMPSGARGDLAARLRDVCLRCLTGARGESDVTCVSFEATLPSTATTPHDPRRTSTMSS
eukprot:TRINITY_DN24901_c0_g1_i1.p1 TRINITY_DN24901_c0_g1~~TRINITY_DN24901_c0_g1_i1.p1  ORF type:complete len:609 (+),score=64.34 TRINITY_DN24901_c0_g1_i1:109-1935(+)